jgi:hypothetical protein
MLTLVRGSYFQMGGRFLVDGEPIDTTPWQSVRVVLADYTGAAVFAELLTEWVDRELGAIKVWADDTSKWPVGRARIDAQILDGFGHTYNSTCDYVRIVESMLNE